MLSILITQMLLGAATWAQTPPSEVTYVPNGQIACLGIPVDPYSFAALVVMGKDAFSRKLDWQFMKEWQGKDPDLQNEGELLIHFADENNFRWKNLFHLINMHICLFDLLHHHPAIGKKSSFRVFLGQVINFYNHYSIRPMAILS